jgi:hypothetical protein
VASFSPVDYYHHNIEYQYIQFLKQNQWHSPKEWGHRPIEMSQHSDYYPHPKLLIEFEKELKETIFHPVVSILHG